MSLLLALLSFTIDPPLITDCAEGLGQATLTWHDAGMERAQVRIGAPDGSPMTGWEGADGSASTGRWVADGMAFYLVNEDGYRLANVTAHVACGSTPSEVDPIFTTGSYLPLRPGNEWTYRVDSRQFTGNFVTWMVDGSREVGGRTYAVIRTGGNLEWLVRQDADGRIFESGPSGDRLFLDPTQPPDPSAVLQINGRGAFTNALGSFPDAINYIRFDSLMVDTGTYVRGLGLAKTNNVLATGSSGGFVEGMELIQARIEGRLILRVPEPGLEVRVESALLDVTDKKVRNCAVPCYFAACGLAPGSDPPNTWKPCFSAEVRAGGDSAVMTFEDSAGRVLRQFDVTGGNGTVSIPLYEEPNRPYPAGSYRVRARGSKGAEGSMAVTIE